MPQFNQTVGSEGLNAYYGGQWRYTGTADYGSYGGGPARLGIIHFSNMNLTGKKILSVKLAAKTSASGANAIKYVLLFDSKYNGINTGLTGLDHLGEYRGMLSQVFYNNTIYSMDASFLANSVAAGVNTFIIYHENEVSYGATGYSANYLKWTSVSISVDYEDAVGGCTPPTSFTLSPKTDTKATLAWSGASGGTGNDIWGYAVQYRDSTDKVNWGVWTNLVETTATSIEVDVPIAGYRQFRVQTWGMVEGLGLDSEWAVCPHILTLSNPPAVPTVNRPSQNGITYNPSPYVLVTLGTCAGTQTLEAAGYTASAAGSLASGRKLVLKRTSALTASGSQTISLTAKDTSGATSPTATRTFSFRKAAYQDAALAPGVTPIRAEHIAELCAMVNTMRAYYGLSAKAWAETVTAGVTKLAGWKAHVLELRAAMEDIAALVNGWDTASTTNKIKLPVWIDIPVNAPSVAVMRQLREALVLL